MAYEYKYKRGDWKRIGTHTMMRLMIYYRSPLDVNNTTKTIHFKVGYEVEHNAGININPYGTCKDNSGHNFSPSYHYNPSSAGTHSFLGDWHEWNYVRTTSSRSITISFKIENDAYTYHPSVSLDFTVPALEKFTIKYNGNGATSGMPSSTTQTVYYGKTITIASAPQKTGHKFNTWQGSNGKPYSPGSKSTITSNLTLTAQWTIKPYTLTYNPNGGSVSPTSKSVNYGSPYGTLPTPTLTGYTFLGWFTTQTGNTQVTSSTVMGADNVTIYAHWQINNYDLTFNTENTDVHVPPYDEGESKISVPYHHVLDRLTGYFPIHKPYLKSEQPLYYYSYYLFNGWFHNGNEYSSGNVMPAYNLALTPKWITGNSFFPNIAKVTAIRAEYNSQTQAMDFNDTGSGCVVIIDSQPFKIYRFDKDNNGDTRTLITPSKIKVHVDIDGSDTDKYEVYINNEDSSFPIKVNIYQGSPHISKAMVFSSSYTINATITGIIDEGPDGRATGNPSNYFEVGTSAVKSDLLTKAQFTIDISADGDRIGIFQPIEDYDENNPTDYPKSEIELTGAMYTTPTSTIDLGSCFVPCALTNTGGKLYFSIPTGRVFNKNLRVASLSFGIVTRQGNSNGDNGVYITSHPEASNSTGATYRPWSPAPFNYVYGTPPTGSFAFKNAELVYKTVDYNDIKVSIEGNTNIRVLINDTNTTQVFSGSLYTYLNNQPGVIELSNIQLTLAEI